MDEVLFARIGLNSLMLSLSAPLPMHRAFLLSLEGNMNAGANDPSSDQSFADSFEPTVMGGTSDDAGSVFHDIEQATGASDAISYSLLPYPGSNPPLSHRDPLTGQPTRNGAALNTSTDVTSSSTYPVPNFSTGYAAGALHLNPLENDIGSPPVFSQMEGRSIPAPEDIVHFLEWLGETVGFRLVPL